MRSHYLNRLWPSLMKHKRVTWHRWVNNGLLKVVIVYYRSYMFHLFTNSWSLPFIASMVVFLWLMELMMTSSNGNIFRISGPLCGEFAGHRWIPHTKASYAELWCFLWSPPEKNGRVNNREAGELRLLRAHGDVTVTQLYIFAYQSYIHSNTSTKYSERTRA